MVGSKGPNPQPQPDYGTADCIDCGKHTPRRLMDHIPHICTNCLFPSFNPINLVTDSMRQSRPHERRNK